MHTEDFFDEVVEQLNGESGRSRLEQLEQSQESFRDQPSWLSVCNLSGSGEFLKRKPLKGQGRMTQKIICAPQLKTKISLIPQKSSKIDVQLNRLERTLNYSKNKSKNPHFKRQKTMLKRIQLMNKQNEDGRIIKRQEDFNLTSQFLQEIKGVSQQLYEIYLSLYRFYQKEKDENEKMGQQMKQVNKEVYQNTVKLEQFRYKLIQIEQNYKKQVSSQSKAQSNILKASLLKYFEAFK